MVNVNVYAQTFVVKHLLAFVGYKNVWKKDMKLVILYVHPLMVVSSTFLIIKQLMGKSELICTHIELFPTMESHYCRKDSQLKSLDATLSIRLMYQEFVKYYNTMILKEGKDPSRPALSCPSELVYRRSFLVSFQLELLGSEKGSMSDMCKI